MKVTLPEIGRFGDTLVWREKYRRAMSIFIEN